MEDSTLGGAMENAATESAANETAINESAGNGSTATLEGQGVQNTGTMASADARGVQNQTSGNGGQGSSTPADARGVQNQETAATGNAAEKPLSAEQKEDFSPDWRAQLPDSMRELAKDFESREAFTDAVRRGAAYKPALKPEELEYAPEGVEMDPNAARQFRELGVKIGLTAEQARALVDFEAGAVAERARKNAEEGAAFLKQKWGAEYENNVGHAKRALLALDNRTDGRLSRLFGGDGLGTVPSLMEAFALIGKDMAEDSAAEAKSAASSGRESALGMFAGMFH